MKAEKTRTFVSTFVVRINSEVTVDDVERFLAYALTVSVDKEVMKNYVGFVDIEVNTDQMYEV